MAGFLTILQDIGKGFAKVFDVTVEAAQVAEPIVDVLLPGFATVFNGVVAEAAQVEALASAAGKQNGTGAQKLALVVGAVTPSILSYAKAQGLTTPTAEQITAFVNAAVAALNALPAAPTPAA
jgi:hypothetical protein